MITEKDGEKCMSFLEAARTAIEQAEMHIANAIDSELVGRILCKACGEVDVAAKNLVWVSQEIGRIATEIMEGIYNARTADGSTAGSTLPAGRKTSSN